MSLFLLWGRPFMTRDGPKMVHFGPIMAKHSPSGSSWAQMGPAGPKWVQLGPKGSRMVKTLGLTILVPFGTLAGLPCLAVFEFTGGKENKYLE